MADEPTSADMRRLVDGFQVSQALYAASELGIPDFLREGMRSADELAAAAGADAPTLYRLLRALAAVGVLREDDSQQFTLTALGQFLRTDHPASAAPWLAQVGRPYFWQAWGNLTHSVRTGETAFDALHGTDVWSWRASQPEENAVFNRAMTGLSRMANAAITAAYDFSRFGHIVDVGGGNGAFLAAILQATPGARGTVFDLPHVVAGVEAVVADAGVADRCDAVGGSMFESVPAGADAYVMKAVLHDWDDARCGSILGVCREAMSPDARLLVVERIVGPPNRDAVTKLSDLNMLALPGGRERTEDEFAALFGASGFRLASVTRTGSPMHVIEAAPA
jgi:hypothetical protein